jgi:hypothetical protein
MHIQKKGTGLMIGLLVVVVILQYTVFGGISFFDTTEEASEYASTLSDSPIVKQTCLPGFCYVYHFDSWWVAAIAILLVMLYIAWHMFYG